MAEVTSGELTVVVLNPDEVELLSDVFDKYFNLQGERIARLLDMGNELEAKRQEKRCFRVGGVFAALVPDVLTRFVHADDN